MLFKLDTPTEAKLVTFTARTERHGKEDVAALTLGLSITAPNPLLDLLSPTLRHALYSVADDYTPGLDGIEPPTPKLRTKQLVSPLALNIPEIKGGRLYVQWGTGEDMIFEMTGLGKWRLDAYDGGTVTLGFKVSFNDVSEEEAGHLFGKQGQMLHVQFQPPTLPTEPEQTGQVIDGTTGHPGGDGPLFEEPDDPDSEGGTTDATEAFVEAHSEQPAKRGRRSKVAA